MPALIIHGHFYQPPRENPWTGVVEEQPSAAPFHDWNDYVHAECYEPNGCVVLRDQAPPKAPAINNYADISFDFGPTLLSWLHQYRPQTYKRIIDADRESVLKHGGHGNAMAQAYGHAILPLCNDRDLRTQVRWGLADFRFRFGREAEAMWLPETACNDRVLNALIDEGLRYVILEPHQAAQVIDTSIPYRYHDASDPQRSIAVFFYDGATSRAIAFEGLLRSSRELVDALARSATGKEMVNVATDGETYGHHFKFGDLCLAHALTVEAPRVGFTITNYGEYLDTHLPEFEVKINNGWANEGTSWSCPHGVGRWARDCGCRTGGGADWNQQWRAPLRQALDCLRDENIRHFEATRGGLFTFPWLARDESISLILDPHRSREQFLFEQSGRWMSTDEKWRALTYLELQRMLLLMYTSCGWFFNDISGIETIQVLRYAARAIDLMEQLKLPPTRQRVLEILSEAKSNRPEMGTGADIFRRFAESTKPNSCSADR